jgi:hypothetical protein
MLPYMEARPRVATIATRMPIAKGILLATAPLLVFDLLAISGVTTS